jgi:hypothetical protein
MLKDKSKLLLLGALVVLVLALSNGALFAHGIGFHGFHGWPKIFLIGLVIWMLCGGRGSCCGGGSGSEDAAGSEDNEEAEETEES